MVFGSQAVGAGLDEPRDILDEEPGPHLRRDARNDCLILSNLFLPSLQYNNRRPRRPCGRRGTAALRGRRARGGGGGSDMLSVRTVVRLAGIVALTIALIVVAGAAAIGLSYGIGLVIAAAAILAAADERSRRIQRRNIRSRRSDMAVREEAMALVTRHSDDDNDDEDEAEAIGDEARVVARFGGDADAEHDGKADAIGDQAATRVARYGGDGYDDDGVDDSRDDRQRRARGGAG